MFEFLIKLAWMLTKTSALLSLANSGRAKRLGLVSPFLVRIGVAPCCLDGNAKLDAGAQVRECARVLGGGELAPGLFAGQAWRYPK
jgi:hypothetical protein